MYKNFWLQTVKTGRRFNSKKKLNFVVIFVHGKRSLTSFINKATANTAENQNDFFICLMIKSRYTSHNAFIL